MLTSEASTAYDLALDAFLASHMAQDVPGIYHAVRKLGYFSSEDRSPDAVMRTGRGACTAKHILLRDLLRRHGERADVELVAGDFAAGIPEADSMPDPLRAMIRAAGVRDFHCYVVWQGPDREIRLDATWPDALGAHGFGLNADWAGTGHTRLAITPVEIPLRSEDVIAAKARLLADLTADDAEKRLKFLKLLSDWIVTVS